MPAKYIRPYSKGQKNDFNDATMKFVATKTAEQLDLQAQHRVRERLVSQRTGIINQIRAFMLERRIAVRQGIGFLRTELPTLLATRTDALSPRMLRVIEELAGDWRRLDQGIDGLSGEIEAMARQDQACWADHFERHGSRVSHAKQIAYASQPPMRSSDTGAEERAKRPGCQTGDAGCTVDCQRAFQGEARMRSSTATTLLRRLKLGAHFLHCCPEGRTQHSKQSARFTSSLLSPNRDWPDATRQPSAETYWTSESGLEWLRLPPA
jgi:hypothetical protein